MQYWLQSFKINYCSCILIFFCLLFPFFQNNVFLFFSVFVQKTVTTSCKKTLQKTNKTISHSTWMIHCYKCRKKNVLMGSTHANKLYDTFNPTALRIATTRWSFGHSECNRINGNGYTCTQAPLREMFLSPISRENLYIENKWIQQTIGTSQKQIWRIML